MSADTDEKLPPVNSFKQTLRSAFIAASRLMVFAAVGAAILAATYVTTAPKIRAEELSTLQGRLNQVFPPALHNGDLNDNLVRVRNDAFFSAKQTVTVYRAYKDNKPVGAIFDVVTPDGYSGDIRLLVGVKINGEISAVRVVTHRETPGLGDKIDLAKSQWITSFNGKSLYSVPDNQWAVKKDGGNFDAFAGATITPRAVVSVVKNTLLYFKQNQSALFALPNESTQQSQADSELPS